MSSVYRPWSLPNPSLLKWAQGSLSIWHWIHFSGADMKQDLGRRLIEKCMRNRVGQAVG